MVSNRKTIESMLNIFILNEWKVFQNISIGKINVIYTSFNDTDLLLL